MEIINNLKININILTGISVVVDGVVVVFVDVLT